MVTGNVPQGQSEIKLLPFRKLDFCMWAWVYRLCR